MPAHSRTGVLTVFAPFALGFFLSYLFRVVNAVIAPDLIAALGIDPGELGLLTSAYFLAFVVTQVPLGVALDRWGPRRIEAALLVVAAAGALLFARASSLGELIAGRALIGIGVSACLMAPFKAYSRAFPSEQLPMIHGLQLAAGGVGALVATYPVEIALTITDWRGVFVALAVLTIAIAALIVTTVPRHDEASTTRTLRDQLRDMRAVYTSPSIIRLAPWPAISQASFLAVQGLWAGPWLRDVAGYSRSVTAFILMLVALAMITGYVTMGAIAARMERRGVSALVVMWGGMSVFALLLAVLIAPPGPHTPVVWVLVGYFGTSGTLAYAILSRRAPVAVAGMVNTAHNLLVFIAAFAAQWGVGEVIRSVGQTGPSAGRTVAHYSAAGYRMAFAVLLAALAAGMVWTVMARGLRRRSTAP